MQIWPTDQNQNCFVIYISGIQSQYEMEAYSNILQKLIVLNYRCFGFFYRKGRE